MQLHMGRTDTAYENAKNIHFSKGFNLSAGHQLKSYHSQCKLVAIEHLTALKVRAGSALVVHLV